MLSESAASFGLTYVDKRPLAAASGHQKKTCCMLGRRADESCPQYFQPRLLVCWHPRIVLQAFNMLIADHVECCPLIAAQILSFIGVQATKEGGTVQSVSPEEPGRLILWARYVDWSLTTPLLLLDLATLVQLPFFKIIRLVSVDLLMIITGLFAAVAGIESKWGWFAFSMAFFIGVLYDLLTSGLEASKEIGGEVESKYKILGLGTVALWAVYPVVWVAAEGLDKISVDQEVRDLVAPPPPPPPPPLTLGTEAKWTVYLDLWIPTGWIHDIYVDQEVPSS